MKHSKYGYMLMDTLLSVTCILILSLPILKSFSIIAKEQSLSEEYKNLLNIIDEQEDHIMNAKTVQEILQDKTVRGYLIKMEISKKIDDYLTKYKVIIYKEGEIKSEFYIIKYFQ